MQAALDFFQAHLDTVVGGNSIFQYIIALAIVVVGWITGSILNSFVAGRLAEYAKKTETKLDDLVIGVLGGPVKLIGLVVGISIAGGTLDPASPVPMLAEDIAVSLGNVGGAWILFRLLDGLVELYVLPFAAKTEAKIADVVVPVAVRGAKVVIAVFALLMAVQTLGMQVEPLTQFFLNVGLGLVGVAILSTVWVLRSVVGGLVLLAGRPFAEGDRIACGPHEGTIEKLALHQTILVTAEGVRVSIPNHDLVTSRVALLVIAPRKKTSILQTAATATPGAEKKKKKRTSDEAPSPSTAPKTDGPNAEAAAAEGSKPGGPTPEVPSA